MSPQLDHIRKAISSGEAVIVDVREEDEWQAGHLTDAQWAPLSQLKENQWPDDLPKEKQIYLYCARGMRAQVAAALLKAHYPSVEPLMFGYEDLKLANFSTVEVG